MHAETTGLDLTLAEMERRLERRLAQRLERRVRRVLLLGCVMSAGAFCLGAALPGQSQSAAAALRGNRVRAPFTVVDRQGKPLFTIDNPPIIPDAPETRAGRMVLYGRPGTPLLSVGITSPQGGGRTVAQTRFILNDDTGTPIVRMGNEFDGRFRGLEIPDVAQLGVTEFGDLPAGLEVFGPSGRASVQVRGTGPRIRLTDPNGGVVFAAPAGE